MEISAVLHRLIIKFYNNKINYIKTSYHTQSGYRHIYINQSLLCQQQDAHQMMPLCTPKTINRQAWAYGKHYHTTRSGYWTMKDFLYFIFSGVLANYSMYRILNTYIITIMKITGHSRLMA